MSPQDEDEDDTTGQSRRPPSPYHYSLAIDYTAAKIVTALINKCKLFQCVSSLFQEESQELLVTLVGLHQILQNIVGSPCFVRFHETLEDVLLYSTKAFAFLEKLCFKALPHESTHGVHKAGAKMNELACRFFNQTVRLCHDYNNVSAWNATRDTNSTHNFHFVVSRNCCKLIECVAMYPQGGDDVGCGTPREERLSFGVTTYVVPVHNLAQRLLKKKRVHIPLTDLENTSEYNVELSYPRSWFSKDVAMSAKIESSDRGFSQTLHADRVNIAKGSWGWEGAQDTVLITYDDFVVANVASVTGSMLTYNKHSRLKVFNAQKYRTSIQIVGASRIDLDLQNLFIKGVKEKDLVFYKCFVNTTGREEVLGIYRFQPKQQEGMLHIVARGNQPGLRHVLISIFASLGFTAAA